MLAYTKPLLDSLFLGSHSKQFITIDPGLTNIGVCICDINGIRMFNFNSSRVLENDSGFRKSVDKLNFIDLQKCGESLGLYLFDKRVNDEKSFITTMEILIEKQDGRKHGFYKYENIMSSMISTLSALNMCNGMIVSSADSITVPRYKKYLNIPVFSYRGSNKVESLQQFNNIRHLLTPKVYIEEESHDTCEAFHMMMYLLHTEITSVLKQQKIIKKHDLGHKTYEEMVLFIMNSLFKHE